MGEEFASIVIIKRTGADGPRFTLRRKECLFGRDAGCDLRVQLPGVALEHAKISRSENCDFYLENMTGDCETMINGKLINKPVELSNLDVFSIAGRSFRFEYEQPRKKILVQKMLDGSKNLSGSLISPFQEANRTVKDSPRNPLRRRASLRESLGKLRRSSVPFQEVPEPVSGASLSEQQQVCLATKSHPNTPISSKKHLKRVSFGPDLSPEQFDAKLPVSTPVKKGAAPRRLSTPLSKPCLSPARRRYSMALPSFVAKIVEETEERNGGSDDEKEAVSSKAPSPRVEIVEIAESERPRMTTPLRVAQPRPTRRRMASMLQDEIKSGVELRKTKQSLKTPLRKEIQSGVSLRKTKRKMASMFQDEIISGVELRKTKQSLKTPLKKEIQSGVNLRKTKPKMASMLQDEIKSGVELRKTKQSLKTPLKKEIQSGVRLRKTKRKMASMLQDEIKSGVELRKTKQSLKTPLRKEIQSGVNLRKTKRKMTSMLQNEIKSGVQLSKTKQSMNTSLRKEIESGVQLRPTKCNVEPLSKTPKRRLSTVDDNTSRCSRKKLKTPRRDAGFFPTTRSASRRSSLARRPSTKKPSYAEILKRPTIVAKRRLSTRQKCVFKFEAEQQTSLSTSKASAAVSEVTKGKSKTPSRRKSQARRKKIFDGKISDDWNVVVNKRKIKKIIRQRAVKPHQELELDSLPILFKTPKTTRSQARVQEVKEETVKVERSIKQCQPCCSPVDDSILYGVAKLMKTPKVKVDAEQDYEGLPELFEVLEMTSPIPVTTTPSLRRPLEHVSIVSPSLHVKEDKNIPLPLSSTPAPPTVADAVTVVAANENPSCTPSLRRVSASLTVVSAESTCTPSLRNGANNLTVVAADEPVHTPSLRKAAENVTLASPLCAIVTPSLRNPVDALVVKSATPVQFPSPTIPIARSPVAVVSPLPMQSQATSLSSNVTSPSRESATTELQPGSDIMISPVHPPLSSKDIKPEVSPLKDEAPSASIISEAKRTLRSKRKAEADALPEVKRPRRTASRTDNRNKSVHELLETLNLDEQAKNDIKLNGERDTRKSRRKPAQRTQTSQAKTLNPTKKRIVRSGKSKNVAGVPETPQPLQFSKTKLDPIIEVPTPASSLRGGGSVKKLLTDIKNQRLTRSGRGITTVCEETIGPVTLVLSSDESSDEVPKNQDVLVERRVTRPKRSAPKERSCANSKASEKDLATNNTIVKEDVTEQHRKNEEKGNASADPMLKPKRATRSRRQAMAPKNLPKASEEDVHTAPMETRSTRNKRQVSFASEADVNTKGTTKVPKEEVPPSPKRTRSSRNKREAPLLTEAKTAEDAEERRAKRSKLVVVAGESLTAPKRRRKLEGSDDSAKLSSKSTSKASEKDLATSNTIVKEDVKEKHRKNEEKGNASANPMLTPKRATRSRRQAVAPKNLPKASEQDVHTAPMETRSARNKRQVSFASEADVNTKGRTKVSKEEVPAAPKRTRSSRKKREASPSTEAKTAEVAEERRATRSKLVVVAGESLTAPKRRRKLEGTDGSAKLSSKSTVLTTRVTRSGRADIHGSPNTTL